MEKEQLDNINLEELLKLLESSDVVQDNNAFISLLNYENIKSGKYDVPVSLLLKIFNTLRPKNKLTIKKIIDASKDYLEVFYKKNKPYFKLNKPYRYLKRFYIKPKKSPISMTDTLKYEYFLEVNEIGKGNYKVYSDTIYTYYQSWCKDTRKQSPFNKETFLKITNIYFNKINKHYYLLNKTLE